MTVNASASVTVRRPRAGDWARVIEILKSVNFYGIGGLEMPRFEPKDCFVTELAGTVVGVAGYEILDAVTAKTTLLAVDRAARGQGVGSALQRRRLAYLSGQGVRTLYTNCDDPAVVAWNCRHFGFRPTGRIIPKEEPFGRAESDSWTNLRLELDPDSRVMLPDLPTACEADAAVHELTDVQVDDELQAAVTKLLDAMRRNETGFLNEHFRPDPAAKEAVSETVLVPLLTQEAWISDIVEDRRISNCIAYNFDNVGDAIMDDALVALRHYIDNVMLTRARALFPLCPDLTVENTGHFWYPRGSYMGWHTNLRTPGWRCYISIADVPDRSFFRYRVPGDGRVVTSWDRIWNMRLFYISPAAPLWHAVYSDTNRFSLGYKIILN